MKNLIVIEGNSALNIINHPILKNKTPLCQINNLKISLFDLAKHETVVVVSEEKDLNYFASATFLLQKWIEVADNVVGLALTPKAEFKGIKTIESCFMRGINSKFEDIKPLEVPNFITGVLAGVATYRKYKDLPYSCYVHYHENYDIITIKEILNFLKKLGLPCDDTAKIRSLNYESNLYS